MERKDTFNEELLDVKNEIHTYIQNKIDLTKLQLAEDLSRFISSVAIKLVMFYISLFILIFLSMAAAFYIGTFTQSDELGFIIVAGFYMFVAVIFYLLKRTLVQRHVIKSFIQLFFPNFSRYDKK